IGQLGTGLLLFTRGARLIPVAEASLIAVLESVLGPVWVWLVVGERPGVFSLAGGAVILSALVAHTAADLARPPVRERADSRPRGHESPASRATTRSRPVGVARAADHGARAAALNELQDASRQGGAARRGLFSARGGRRRPAPPLRLAAGSEKLPHLGPEIPHL